MAAHPRGWGPAQLTGDRSNIAKEHVELLFDLGSWQRRFDNLPLRREPQSDDQAGRTPGPIAVTLSPGDSLPIGVGHEAGHVGGRVDDVDLGPAEVVWRLVIGGQEIGGRHALRTGEFVELAEEVG